MPSWGGGGANSGARPAAAEEVTEPVEATDTTAEEPAEASDPEMASGE